jgi:hypothetical protein
MKPLTIPRIGAAKKPPVQAVQNVQVVEAFDYSKMIPNPDVLAQEIVEDLEAALEHFREIAVDFDEKALMLAETNRHVLHYIFVHR